MWCYNNTQTVFQGHCAGFNYFGCNSKNSKIQEEDTKVMKNDKTFQTFAKKLSKKI